MIRQVNRKKLAKKSVSPIKSAYQSTYSPITTLSFSSPKFISANGLTQIRNNKFSEDLDIFNYSLIVVIIIAIAEEYLFRGYVISIAYQIQNNLLMYLMILSSMVIFACSHLSHSWHEVKYKIPLTLITTLEFIITKTLLSAIITHLMLNAYAYDQKRKWFNE